jgi:hypothetical protein
MFGKNIYQNSLFNADPLLSDLGRGLVCYVRHHAIVTAPNIVVVQSDSCVRFSVIAH